MTTATATIEPAAEPTNALALIETKTPLELFSNNGLDPILEKIEEEARAEAASLDISTPQSRKALASLSHKIARTKTALDAAGKGLVAGWKESAKKVDVERARGWDRLEALQKEIREPLTAWENAEKARVDGHEAAIAAIPEHPNYGQNETAAELTARLAHLENLPPRDWQEFSVRAAKVLADEIDRTKALLSTAEKREAEAAELARLRQEQAEREQRERDERIAAEAAAQAKAQAEEAARLASDEEAARVRASQEAAEQERQRFERERDEADARARKAEDDRIAAAAKAEADRKEAAEKAERDRKAAEEAAAKRERDRIDAEQRQAAEDAAKREADKKHRTKVNGEALAALVAAGLSEDDARTAITAIAKNEVPNVKISY